MECYFSGTLLQWNVTSMHLKIVISRKLLIEMYVATHVINNSTIMFLGQSGNYIYQPL
jgi:hypothetical protein